jgi:hypothetical protein|tara:strand:+ start:839 stop:1078 length:240 start_codon:yes stop_codon:yes gene_type:complete
MTTYNIEGKFFTEDRRPHPQDVLEWLAKRDKVIDQLRAEQTVQSQEKQAVMVENTEHRAARSDIVAGRIKPVNRRPVRR